MLVLLLTVGKSAIIENIPMQAAYVLLFLLNFTNVFPVKKAEKAPAKRRRPSDEREQKQENI